MYKMKKIVEKKLGLSGFVSSKQFGLNKIYENAQEEDQKYIFSGASAILRTSNPQFYW